MYMYKVPIQVRTVRTVAAGQAWILGMPAQYIMRDGPRCRQWLKGFLSSGQVRFGCKCRPPDPIIPPAASENDPLSVFPPRLD